MIGIELTPDERYARDRRLTDERRGGLRPGDAC